jgi:type I restriction enzyme S subunit
MTSEETCEFQQLFSVPLRNGLTRPKAVRGVGVNMVNMGEVFAHRRIRDIPMERVSLSEKEARDYLLEEGDLLFARQSLVLAGAGKCSIFLSTLEPATFESHLIRARLRQDIADPHFYFYFFQSRAGRNTIESITEQVAAAGIRGSDLARLTVPKPSLSEQAAIARILATLDDKIELNRRMNETLEAIARAMFKSWFVDFDPVRAKAEGRQPFGMNADTAVLFSNSFQDSPIGKIPKGWTIEEIRKRTSNIQYGLTRSATKDKIGPRFLRITDIQGGRIDWEQVPYCPVSAEELSKYQIWPGDIFVARTGASTGENIYIVAAPNSVFASYLVRFQLSDASVARVVGEFMRTTAYFDFVANAIGGSAQPNASAQVLASALFAFPPTSIAKRFAESVRPLDERRVLNDAESRTLALIRDALLPKLISGEIRVKGRDKNAELV